MQEVRLFNKIVGYIRANGETPPIYITNRKRDEHYFIKHKGYGMSTKILRDLKTNNVKTIVIIEETDPHTKRKLTTTVNTYFEKGIRHKNEDADYQIILPEKHFKKDWKWK